MCCNCPLSSKGRVFEGFKPTKELWGLPFIKKSAANTWKSLVLFSTVTLNAKASIHEFSFSFLTILFNRFSTTNGSFLRFCVPHFLSADVLWLFHHPSNKSTAIINKTNRKGMEWRRKIIQELMFNEIHICTAEDFPILIRWVFNYVIN